MPPLHDCITACMGISARSDISRALSYQRVHHDNSNLCTHLVAVGAEDYTISDHRLAALRASATECLFILVLLQGNEVHPSLLETAAAHGTHEYYGIPNYHMAAAACPMRGGGLLHLTKHACPCTSQHAPLACHSGCSSERRCATVRRMDFHRLEVGWST